MVIDSAVHEKEEEEKKRRIQKGMAELRPNRRTPEEAQRKRRERKVRKRGKRRKEEMRTKIRK